MKNATGELNMTLLLFMAIAAISGLFVIWILPKMQKTVNNKMDSSGLYD